MALLPHKPRLNDPDLRDRLYELLEQDHLPYSVGSRFARLIVSMEAAKGDLAAAEIAQASHDDQPPAKK